MAVILRATKGSALTHSELDANFTSESIGEPKGAAAASTNEAYLADGAGSGAWETMNPHGGWRYTNIGTGTTFTTPTSYTLMNVVGGSTHLKQFTNNSLGRLTYTGTPQRHAHCVVDLSFKHSTGSGQDCFFAAYKNGSIIVDNTNNAEIVRTADSGNYGHVALHFDTLMATNDYIEIFLKVATGSITIHNAYLFAMGMPNS